MARSPEQIAKQVQKMHEQIAKMTAKLADPNTPPEEIVEIEEAIAAFTAKIERLLPPAAAQLPA